MINSLQRTKIQLGWCKFLLLSAKFHYFHQYPSALSRSIDPYSNVKRATLTTDLIPWQIKRSPISIIMTVS